jgi:hypothetical protein
MSSRAFRTCALLLTLGVALAACDLPFGGAAPASFDSKSATDILAAARDAVAATKTVHVTIRTTDPQYGDIVLQLDVAQSGDIVGTGTVGGAALSVVAAGGKTYVKGSDFWTKLLTNGSSGDTALQSVVRAKIDDNWVTGFDLLGANRAELKTTVLADCLDEHGTLTKKGTDTVNGRKVVVLQDKGENPGGQRGTMAIAVDSPHVLVRLQANGGRTPGTEPDKGSCKGSKGPTPTSTSPAPSTTESTVDFGKYDETVKLTVPSQSVDIASLFSG